MIERILVVEDDDLIRDSLVDVLTDHGYEAHGAADGQEALNKLAELTDPPPCLIVLDLMMPNMDGREFRRRQLADPAVKEIPIVVISAFRDLDSIVKELAPAGHFKKPVKLSDFLQIIQTYCPAAAV